LEFRRVLFRSLLLRSQKSSINVRAAFAHVLSDALGSCAAILAGLAVVFFGWYRADPVLSVAIALLVAYSGYRVLRETAGILLEGVPPHLDVGAIERTILECPGVAQVHDLHVWRISDRLDTLTAHVALERGSHGTDVCRVVAERLERDYGLDHVTIQPEPPPPDDLVRVRRSRDGAPLSRAGSAESGRIARPGGHERSATRVRAREFTGKGEGERTRGRAERSA